MSSFQERQIGVGREFQVSFLLSLMLPSLMNSLLSLKGLVFLVRWSRENDVLSAPLFAACPSWTIPRQQVEVVQGSRRMLGHRKEATVQRKDNECNGSHTALARGGHTQGGPAAQKPTRSERCR